MDNIVFEIGTEELPALELHSLTNCLKADVCKRIDGVFSYDDVEIYTTPRRIIIKINNVPDKIEAQKIVSRGPATRIAFSDNKPTKAAEGFAKSNGLSVDELVIKEENGEEYVFATKEVPEKNIVDLLPDLFLQIINGISWKKSQRWGNHNEEFARPIRWLFAMFGDKIIDVEYAGLHSSNVSYGHRFLAPEKIDISKADDLLNKLESAYVVTTEAKREEIIREQVSKIENDLNLQAELPASVMQEVVNLCEYPTCMVGQFDELFLEVPKEIIVDAMLVHQRYFPLFDNNALTNKFIIISNGNPDKEATIVDGNQRVVAARLYDAKFFFDEDRKNSLESYVEKLDNVVFQEDLGNMKLKAQRISALAGKIAEKSNLSENEIKLAKRAGLLAKADLITNAVIEFTQVQGIMGFYYAECSGEPKEVSVAIKEHYMPKFAGDTIPNSSVSKSVALADKIDTLCGMFAVNQVPSGSSDPFALRRGAIGILSIMNDDFDFSLVDVINYSLELYENDGIKFNKQETFNKIIEFILTRTKVLLKDDGVDHDSIEAVSSIKVEEPKEFINRAKALDAARKESPEIFEDLAIAFARANNLRDSKLSNDVDVSILNEAEYALYDAIQNQKENIKNKLSANDYMGALTCLAALRSPIDNFFDKVMIMDKDEKLKNNRLKLLNLFVEIFSDIADFSKMAKSK